MNYSKSIFTVPASFSQTGNVQATPTNTNTTTPASQARPQRRYTYPGLQSPLPSATDSATGHDQPANPQTPARTSPSLFHDETTLVDAERVANVTASDQRAPALSRAFSRAAAEQRSEGTFEKARRVITQSHNTNHHKRRFNEGPDDSASPAAAAPKRLRQLPRRKHILDPFDFAGPSFDALQPPSPLFFSHSPHIRPALPARFSSSEAAAKMLSKAKTEDSHIKTVSLARGTVVAPFGPTSTPLRASSDRSSIGRSDSPDSNGRGDVSSLGTLQSISMLEFLEQDERPVMIVDLGETNNYGIGPLRPVFINASLRAYQGLLESVTGSFEDEQGIPDAVKVFVQFKSWLLSASVDGESLNVCLPSFLYAGMSWSCSTLRRRLRVVSGAHVTDRFTTPPPKLKSAQISLPRRPTPNEPAATLSADAPQDYFGEASSRPSLAGRTASSDIMSTTETPMSIPLSSNGLMIHNSDPSSEAISEQEPEPSFDWTRIPVNDSMPPHIQFARSIDWASTALGPIEHWCSDLRQMCNLIMASPHPAAMYWGEDLVAIYNEAYIMLAGQKHPKLMGQSYREAWVEIWDEVEEVFANARMTGQATMKDDDCLFMQRNGYLEETYFSWSIIPMVGSDGKVTGLYNPAFEKTRRKIAERRMLTLREVGERTASARDVKGFWDQVLGALGQNEYDTPMVLLYSVGDDGDSDASSMHSSSVVGTLTCTLEGSLGVPQDHVSAPATIDFKQGTEGFGPVFREVIKTDRPVLLEVGTKDLPSTLLEGLEERGFGDTCRAVVVCPIHPTTGESITGFLVLGVNPRRPYDEDYSLFVQLLSRQLATSLASVVLFEEEIRRGQKAAKLAALDRIELSEQLAARTQEAIDSETKFTRMAEFAPVGMFIADSEGRITYCNDTWFDISRVPRNPDILANKWMDAVKEDDQALISKLWHELIVDKKPTTGTFRFKAPWEDDDGTVGERWVLFSAYPEKYESGKLKSVFGSFTEISKQKWAEGFQKRKVEEAVEMKRQQENFIDMTSHEMRNPLSAILQCADEIMTTMTSFKDGMKLDSKSTPTPTDVTVQRNVVSDTIGGTLEAAQTIALCAQHQKRIVDDVLTLSKLDSQLLLVTPVDSQPLTVVQRALKMHEGELHSNDIQLRFVVDESFHTLDIDWVRFDPSRVLQVLINLTTNAIKFTTTEKKRTITVMIAASDVPPPEMSKRMVEYFPSRRSAKEGMFQEKEWGDGDVVYIHFAVQDTGRGLTPEEKKLLFLRFSQASPRTHVQYGGSGLGLFISRELTELQGGEIGVASEAGKGSTFAFYVRARRSRGPAAQKEGAETAPKKVAAPRTTSDGGTTTKDSIPLKAASADQTKHILVVEDNLVNQRVLQKQLRNLGCIVHVANHGGEALDKLRTSTYWSDLPTGVKPLELSVVLMDQEMPVMDGLTCTRKIREMEREGKLRTHVPVIAVTANARSEQIQTALDAGMDDVVSKPFRIPDLIPKIEELMERYPEPLP